ncbi:MAG: S-layer homology domain-containing protein [Clostridia bacterium]|nr:S-layer homology domain-containing protein [Clostridia bacterium]MDD4375970.1 S-layer homology domain-containing protein [Clostridia bacterium]
MNKGIKKTISIFILMVMIVSYLPLGSIVAAVRPSVSVIGPSSQTVKIGGTVSYTVNFYSANVVNLSSSHVRLNGFTANVSVNGSGLDSRTVTLSNIQGTTGVGKSITILAGAASNNQGASVQIPNSLSFALESAVQPDTTRPSVSIVGPSATSVNAGGTITYKVNFYDNKAVTSVNLSSSHVRLNGFTANVSVSGSGITSRTITLSNIQGAAGAGKSITILAGAAQDATGNSTVQTPSSLTFTLASKVITESPDTTRPSVSIVGPSIAKVYSGGTIKYTVNFYDNRGIERVNLSSSYLILNGFTANVSVAGSGVSRTVTLSNIQGALGKNKSITVKAGAAIDAAGNATVQSPKSMTFEIVKKTEVVEPTKPVTPTKPGIPTKPGTSKVTKPAATTKPITVKSEPTLISKCSDDLSLLGDINKEITYFASWLRAEKYTATYIQENNYVAKDETMTYMVEYYNGSTAPTPNVKFRLTIPYNVDVEEISGNGFIVTQTANETVIGWDMGKVQNEARCRLYVRVKFLDNSKLFNSNDISEVFYATLKTEAGGNNGYSYMRQLFIDKNTDKKGEFKKYLSSLDNTNSIRPDDQITRAEFAKLLVDSGIVKVKAGDEAYKTFKDADSIPSYARDAVSALVGTNIIQGYGDGEFKPNNPIVREDLLQMIAQASTYMTDAKITIPKPVFLYTKAIDDKNGEISPKKDYIMELMRQNVIVKYESNPDAYALRKEAVEIINALTFRGPYVEQLPENALRFADIREDVTYFYNIVGASNSYTYNYDYRLWQNILEIK